MNRVGNKRNRNRENLNNLITNSNLKVKYELFNEENFKENVKRICFQNGDREIVIGDAKRFYSYKKCDYDELLIDSPNHWHQIIVTPARKVSHSLI